MSLIKLIAHIVGTAIMFTAILLAAWGLSWLVHHLHGKHPFPEEIYTLVTKIELWLLYIDVALSAIVLAMGAWKFLLELLENWE